MVVNNDRKLVMSNRIILDPTDIAGKSLAILGTNGSGKSGSSRQLAEEHVRLGLPFTIADIENEYATLKNLGDIILAGPGVEYGSFELDQTLTNSAEFYELGRTAYLKSKSVILMLGDLDDETRKTYLKAYLDGIFEAANDPAKRHYYRVFLEECQEYIAQVGVAKSDPLFQAIVRFAKRGRKRMLSLVLISQRPSNVSKDVLTQCHIFILHFVTYATDIIVYRDQLSVDGAEDKVKTMQPGDAIYLFGRTYIEDRITKPKTSSPWDQGEQFDSSTFVKATGVAEIREAVEKAGDKDDEGMSVVPKAYVHKLERQIPELEGQVQSLVEQQIALEDQIEELRRREPIIIEGTADADASVLAIENEALRRALDRAEAINEPITQLIALIRNETSLSP